MPSPRRPPPVRLIGVDMDGTLLCSDDSISPATVKAVARAQAAGIAVIPITGRPDRLVWSLAAEAGLGPIGVCVNGAVLIDLEAGTVLHAGHFSAEASVAVVDAVRAAAPGVALGADHDDGFVYEPGVMAGLDLPERSSRHEVADLRPVVGDGCTKFVARRSDLDSFALAQLLAPALEGAERPLGSDIPATTAEELAVLTASDVGWVDIGPPGYSKGTGLLAACAHLGIDPSAAAAVGDHYNDLPLLATAARPAAMGNAIPEVKALAEVVLASNDDDGVAEWINALVDEAEAAG